MRACAVASFTCFCSAVLSISIHIMELFRGAPMCSWLLLGSPLVQGYGFGIHLCGHVNTALDHERRLDKANMDEGHLQAPRCLAST